VGRQLTDRISIFSPKLGWSSLGGQERRNCGAENQPLKEIIMNTFKSFAIRTLILSAFAATAVSSAHAAIFIRTGVVVAPVAVAPVVVAPLAPVIAAPVVAAPVIAAPVVVMPICRFVSVPVMNAWTGATYLVTRRVCN
jgi:hypothetical protein